MIKISTKICVFGVLCTQLLTISTTPQCYTLETDMKCTLQDSVCLTKKSNAALKYFISGNPELNIEKLDKMYLDSIEIKQDGIIQDLTNVEIEGLKNATINELSFDEVFKIMRLSFETTWTVSCDYTLDGYLFMQPINGAGTTSFTLKNVQTDMIFFYDIVQQDNGNHKLDIKDYRYGLHIKGGAEYTYKNLFRGDKKKNDVLCAFLNKNWPIISNVFGKDMYDRMYGKIFKAIKMYLRSHNLEEMVLLTFKTDVNKKGY